MTSTMRYFYSVVFVLHITCKTNADVPTVEISAGKLVGSTAQFTHEDTLHTVNVYRGIPYAEPPIGDLRFRPPVPKSPWSGEYDATFSRSVCLQNENFFVPVNEEKNEDCLYLNVFVPQHQRKKYSVMVWIHGGGFIYGSGSAIYYDATALSAISDVIVVTLNYRLGAIGFFTTGDSAATGNYGMLDQVEALKWVKNNIEAFGGDTESITIFGESAGSLSVHLHIVSPLSSGLFHRAILQSGAFSYSFGYTDDNDTMNMVANAFGRLTGCKNNTSEELMNCLRQVPGEDFINIQDPATGILENETGRPDLRVPFSPFVDNYFLPTPPMDIISSGSFNKVDTIVGTMADEGMMWILMIYPDSDNDNELFLNKTVFDMMYPFFVLSPYNRYDVVKQAAKYLYTDWENADHAETNYLDTLSQMVGDHLFVCPSDKCVRDLYNAGVDVYLYHMDHHSSTSIYNKTWTKSAHGEDIPFVFGLHLISEMYPDDAWRYSMTDEEDRMSMQIMKYFTNFAKTGNPNLNDDGAVMDVDWPKFTVPELQYKELSPSMPTKRALKAKECAFWNHLARTLMEQSDESKDCSTQEMSSEEQQPSPTKDEL
ncbi:acetylcholinesterase-like [Glandiceps talaboti]